MRKKWSPAKKTIVDGVIFDSKEEADDYQIIKIMLNSGNISDLQLHPRFQLVVNEFKIGRYTADFLFFDKGLKEWIIWERKGRESRDFPLRWKLCQALYKEIDGVPIRYILRK